MAKVICREPGCNALIDQSEGRCVKHKRKGSKNRSGDPFYSRKPWRDLRRERLRIEPLCRECKKDDRVREATRVDHIITRRKRPDLELDIDNTQSLCEPCHNRKTMTTDRTDR